MKKRDKKPDRSKMTDEEKLLELMDRARVFFIATMDGDQPRVRPFGAHLYRDGTLWFGTGEHKNGYRQLQENPKVEISCYEGGDWLRLTGTAVFVDDKEAAKDMLAHAPRMAKLFYKVPGFVQHAILKKFPGLRNMVAPDVKYEDSMKLFYIKDPKATISHLREPDEELHLG